MARRNQNTPIEYGQIYNIYDKLYEEYKYPKRNEIAYGMDQFIGNSDYWNKGIGTQCVKMVINFLRRERNIDAVILDPRQNNTRSVKTHQKPGLELLKTYPNANCMKARRKIAT